MRAVIFEKAGQPWRIGEVADPAPLAGEAVIRVHRCGICGTDISFTSGKGYDFACDSVLGHEYAGEVVAVDQEVNSLQLGDRVTALPCAGCGQCAFCLRGEEVLCEQGSTGYMGGFAEYMRIFARSAVKLPENISFAEGALVEPLAVGLHGVNLANLTPGSRVMVLGAGAVGLAAALWAKRKGAKVVVSSRSGRRAEMALRMGADAFIRDDGVELGEIAEKLGGPPDVVFECIGVGGALQRAAGLVRTQGKVVSLGFCMLPDPVLPGICTFRAITIIFSMAYTIHEFHEVLRQLQSGAVDPRPLVTETIGLAALPAMIDSMRTGAAQTKVQVDPWKPEA